MGASHVHFLVIAADDAGPDLADLLASIAPQREAVRDDTLTLAIGHYAGPDPATPIELFDRSWVSYSRFPQNRGYGGGINQLRRDAPPDVRWIVTCNADLVFVPGSIAILCDLVERAEDDVGLIAPRLLDPVAEGERTQPGIGRFPTLARLLLGRLRSRRIRKYIADPDKSQDIEWATGACLLIRRDAFDEVGGFDPRFFLDYEDTDLCRRLARAGWRRRYEPAWKVIHKRPNAQRDADPARHRHTRSSLVRYFAKHRPSWEVHALGLMLQVTVAFHRRRHPFARGWRAGLATYRRWRRTTVSP